MKCLAVHTVLTIKCAVKKIRRLEDSKAGTAGWYDKGSKGEMIKDRDGWLEEEMYHRKRGSHIKGDL